MSTIKAIVIEKTANGFNGLGEKQFQTLPRAGEFIEGNDASGVGQTYEVIAVVHDDDGNGHDLYVRHVGTSTEFRQNL